MTVPDDFRVGIPHHFAWQTNLETPPDRANPNATPDGVWVEVEGGGIPIPLLVRIDRTHDGRFIITGMLIGRDEHRELDWSTLRSIKPATIVSMIFSGFDPKLPQKLVDDNWLAEQGSFGIPASWGTNDGAEGPEPADQETQDRATGEWVRALKAHDIWRMTGGDSDRAPVTEVTRPRASVATNLTEFAEAYMRHVAADPRRATTATARELHISRATAIRRIKECRDLGLIPQQEQA